MKARQTNSETVTTRERGTARCGRGTGGRGPKPWVTPAKPNDRSLWDAGCLLRTNDGPSVGCVLSSRTTSFRETLTKDLVRFAKLRSCWVGLWLAPDGRARALSSVSSWDFSVFHGAAFASRPGLPWVNSSFQSLWFIDLYRSVTLTGKEFILGNQISYFILLSLSTVDAPFRIFTAPCFLCFVYIWGNRAQAVKIGIKKEEKLTHKLTDFAHDGRQIEHFATTLLFKRRLSDKQEITARQNT